MTAFGESFLFGLANSVHCACMCGPLAMACGSRASATLAYQGGRFVSYAATGALLGGIGSLLGSRSLLGAPAPWVILVLGGALLLFALTGERGALKLPWLGPLLHRIAGWSARQGPIRRGAALGLLTPLLPCGLLWAACAAAAIAGSTQDGSLVMAAFALGGLPLLVLVQGPLGGLVRRLSAARLDLVRRAAMTLCACLLLWRGVLALQGSCCH
jgi:uncharacterized protein